MPARKMFPTSAANAAIRMTVTAWPIAEGSASISSKVAVFAVIAPAIRAPSDAIRTLPFTNNCRAAQVRGVYPITRWHSTCSNDPQ